MEKEENSEAVLDVLEKEDSSVLDVETIDNSSEAVMDDVNPIQEELSSSLEVTPSGDATTENSPLPKKRLLRLPLARIKHIIKSDPDCRLVSQDTVFLVTKATELFLEYLGRESGKFTLAAKRKTVLKRDVEAAIDSIAHLCFLEGALE